MFLAWNEIKRNKLKFSLIICILILISYLLFLLSGLAKGLINMNTEGIKKWNADAIVMNKDANQTVAQSLVDKDKVDGKYKKQAPLKQTGVIASNGNDEENALMFGTEQPSFLVPKIVKGHKVHKDKEVMIDQSLANKGFKVGDQLSLSQSDVKLKVVGVTESAKYNASPVIFANNQTVAKVNPQLQGDKVNAVVVKDKNWKDKSLDSKLEAVSMDNFIEQLPGYKPQNLTLNFMITFLFIISATVIGVFLYVMTLQKKQLFGVLKAQGFTNGYLSKVVLSQTFILALIGTVIGFGLTLLTSAFLPDAVPIKLDLLTLMLFGVALIVISLLGSVFSILSIRKIDPLKAIGWEAVKVIEFDQVTKDFRDGDQTIEAVKPTTLKLGKGEIVAIVGPSGSGKSTLLTMAGALQTPSSGRIVINEQDITQLSQKQLSNIRMNEIGFILQTSNLVPFLTVKQQFELLRKEKKDVMSDEVLQNMLERLGLSKVVNKLPEQVSGGQKQRVAILKALYTNPSLILADEPTASLDTENAMEVMRILRDMSKEQEKTCIIVTHDERLTDYCDQVFQLVDGRLTKQK